MYKVITKDIDNDLKEIQRKQPTEWEKIKGALTQLEASGHDYPGKQERKYKAIKTKYYRILYRFYGDYIICVVCFKKQGQKIEKRHFDLADQRFKEITKGN